MNRLCFVLVGLGMLMNVSCGEAYSLPENAIFVCDGISKDGISRKFYCDVSCIRLTSTGYSYRCIEQTSTTDKEPVFCISDIEYDVDNMRQIVKNVEWRYEESVVNIKQEKEDNYRDNIDSVKRGAVGLGGLIVGGALGLLTGSPDIAIGVAERVSESAAGLISKSERKIVQDKVDIKVKDNSEHVCKSGVIDGDKSFMKNKMYDNMKYVVRDVIEYDFKRKIDDKNYSYAVKELESYVKLFPYADDKYFKMSELLETTAQYRKSLDCYVSACKICYDMISGAKISGYKVDVEWPDIQDEISLMEMRLGKDKIKDTIPTDEQWLNAGIHYKKNNDVGRAYKCFEHASKGNSPLAIYNFAECLFKGEGTKENKIQALTYYKLAADKGYVPALLSYANAYRYDETVGKNYAESVKYYKLAAVAGNPYAQAALGECYELGLGTDIDYDAAYMQYQNATKNGNCSVKEKLDFETWYRKGEDFLEKGDYIMAEKALLFAAKQGNANSQYKLGMLYAGRIGGDNVLSNKNKAFEWIKQAALQGIVDAEYDLGKMYLEGYGTEKSDREGFRWIKKSADDGLLAGQYDTANMLFSGIGTGIDYNDAFRYYQIPAKENYEKARYILGKMHFDGKGTDVDYKLAVDLLISPASAGDMRSQYLVACCYSGGNGVTRDEKKIFSWLEKSANQGYSEAQFKFGKCYEDGIGIDWNYDEAVDWYNKASSSGNKEVKKVLSEDYWYAKAKKLEAVDSVKTAHAYKISAQLGNSDAQYRMGLYCLDGNVFAKDSNMAVIWFEKSSDQNNKFAQCKLAECYYNGIGIGQNFDIAAELYRKAAEQGLDRAQYGFGMCYFDGKGVKQSYEKAVKYYALAVEQCLPEAEFALGVCYELGCGVDKNVKKASELYRKSATQGYLPAIRKLEKG